MRSITLEVASPKERKMEKKKKNIYGTRERLELAYSKRFPLADQTMKAISASKG